MTFQSLLKVQGVSKFLDTKWKIVPSFGSGVGEASFTELSLQKRKLVSKSVRRSEPSLTRQIGGCRYHVRQVARSTADVHQMHKYAQFE